MQVVALRLGLALALLRPALTRQTLLFALTETLAFMVLDSIRSMSRSLLFLLFETELVLVCVVLVLILVPSEPEHARLLGMTTVSFTTLPLVAMVKCQRNKRSSSNLQEKISRNLSL